MSISWDDLVKDAGDVVTSFEPIPEGDYDMEVVEAKPGNTKDGSKKKYTVKARIIGGASNNRIIWDDIILTTDNKNALGFFFKKMAALGLPPDYFSSQRPTDEQITAALKGRRFRGKIGHRVWNGEKKHEIKNYMPAQGGPAVPGAPSIGQASPPPAAAPPAPAAAPPVPAPQAAAPPAPQAPPAPAQQDPWATQAPPAPAAGDPWAQPAPAPQAAPPAAPPAPAAPAAAPPQAEEQGPATPAVPPPPPSPF